MIKEITINNEKKISITNKFGIIHFFDNTAQMQKFVSVNASMYNDSVVNSMQVKEIANIDLALSTKDLAKELRKQNPDLPYHEALKQAAKLKKNN